MPVSPATERKRGLVLLFERRGLRWGTTVVIVRRRDVSAHGEGSGEPENRRVKLSLTSQRVVLPPHHLLHTVSSSDEVREVYCVAPTHANEEVLVVVCHSHNLVGHDLSYREDEVMSSLCHQFVDC